MSGIVTGLLALYQQPAPEAPEYSEVMMLHITSVLHKTTVKNSQYVNELCDVDGIPCVICVPLQIMTLPAVF